MTDPRRPSAEPRPLRALLEEAPGAEPPAWLDANVRAAAAQAAELARQRGAGTGAKTGAGHPGKPDRTGAPASGAGGRSRWGWMPVGATVAVAVLGLMLVISTTVDRKAASPEAESSVTQDKAVRQKALEETRPRADAPTPERDAAVSNEARQPSAAKRERSDALGAAAPAAPTAPAASAAPAAPAASAAPAAPAAAAAPAALATPRAPTTPAADAVAPGTAAACVERIDQLRGTGHTTDARNLLRACRSRFPEHPFPAEMLRELGN